MIEIMMMMMMMMMMMIMMQFKLRKPEELLQLLQINKYVSLFYFMKSIYITTFSKNMF